MDLGLANLNIFEYNQSNMFDDIIVTNEMYDDIRATCARLNEAICVVEHLISLKSVVNKYGSTESINYLYAGNDIYTSMEGIGDILTKVWNTIKQMLSKLFAWFKKILGLNKSASDKTQTNVKKN